MSSTIATPRGMETVNNSPEISRYYGVNDLPYLDIAQVLSEVLQSKRYVGQVFNVNKKEWHFKNGILDSDLVFKDESEKEDKILKYGKITITGNTITIPENSFQWRLDQEDFTVTNSFTGVIQNATDNFYRSDILVGDSFGNIVLIEGVEDEIVTIEPTVPAATIKLATVPVFGSTIGAPVLETQGFKEKAEDDYNYEVTTVDQDILDLTEKSSYMIFGAMTVLRRLMDSETDSPSYSGRVLTFMNKSGHDITFESALSSPTIVDNSRYLLLPDGDIVLKNNHIVVLKQDPHSYNYYRLVSISNSTPTVRETSKLKNVKNYFINESMLPFASSNSVIHEDKIYACVDNKIIKYSANGEELLLLTILGVSEWRCAYKHSKTGKMYFSPMDSYSASMSEIDHGLYCIDPLSDSVTKVIQLAARESIWGIDENTNGEIYAGVYGFSKNASIYKSAMNGTTFTVIYEPIYGGTSQNHTHAICVDKETDYIYICGGDKYGGNLNYKSINGGLSWQEIHVTPINQFTAVIASKGRRIYGTDQSPYGKIYITEDDETLTEVLDTHYQNVFFLRKSDITGWLYAGFKTDPSSTSQLRADLYVSKDNGSNWLLYDTITETQASGGYWFASNFENGSIIISKNIDGNYTQSLLLQEEGFMSKNSNVRNVVVDKVLNDFDNGKLLEVSSNLNIIIPDSGISEGFKCKIYSLGTTKLIGLNIFPSAMPILKPNKQGFIYKRKDKNIYVTSGFEYNSPLFNPSSNFNFNSNSVDSISGKAGTDTDILYQTGKFENCAAFNGTSSRTVVPKDNSFSFTNGTNDLPFSMSFWINFDNLSGVQIIANKQLAENSNREYMLAYSGGKLALILMKQNSGSSFIRANYLWSPDLGDWNHVVLTYDGSKTKEGIDFYINGLKPTVERVSAGTYLGMSNGASDLEFGRNSITGLDYLKAKLDDFTIFKNIKLSLTEVLQIYNSGTGKAYPFE